MHTFLFISQAFFIEASLFAGVKLIASPHHQYVGVLYFGAMAVFAVIAISGSMRMLRFLHRYSKAVLASFIHPGTTPIPGLAYFFAYATVVVPLSLMLKLVLLLLADFHWKRPDILWLSMESVDAAVLVTYGIFLLPRKHFGLYATEALELTSNARLRAGNAWRTRNAVAEEDATGDSGDEGSTVEGRWWAMIPRHLRNTRRRAFSRAVHRDASQTMLPSSTSANVDVAPANAAAVRSNGSENPVIENAPTVLDLEIAESGGTVEGVYALEAAAAPGEAVAGGSAPVDSAAQESDDEDTTSERSSEDGTITDAPPGVAVDNARARDPTIGGQLTATEGDTDAVTDAVFEAESDEDADPFPMRNLPAEPTYLMWRSSQYVLPEEWITWRRDGTVPLPRVSRAMWRSWFSRQIPDSLQNPRRSPTCRREKPPPPQLPVMFVGLPRINETEDRASVTIVVAEPVEGPESVLPSDQIQQGDSSGAAAARDGKDELRRVVDLVEQAATGDDMLRSMHQQRSPTDMTEASVASSSFTADGIVYRDFE